MVQQLRLLGPSDYPATAMKDCHISRIRLAGRYFIASWTIPIWVAAGAMGLVQNWSRAVRGRARRTQPEPVGYPEGDGLRKVGRG